MLLLVLIEIILMVKQIENVENYIIKHPERQIATLNSTITLQCRVKVVDKYEVHWVKDGFGLGNSRADIRQYGQPVNHQHRYDLPFNLEEGEYDLRITDLELSDEGVFYCQIVVDGRAHSSTKVTVQVLVPSEAPQLVQINNEGSGPKEIRNEKNPITVNDGDFLHITCIAKNGRPGAILHWYLNEIKVLTDANNVINGTLVGRVIITTKPNDKIGKLYTTESLLKLKINSLKNGNWLKCIAENRGYENKKFNYTSAQIEVHTIPIVTIETYPKRHKNEFFENDWIEFTCSANGRPNSFYWKWFFNENRIENIADNKYKLRIKRDHHKGIMKCVAISTREGFGTMKLFVKYGPKFKDPEPLVTYPALIGGKVSMNCEADGNPSPSVHWRRQSSNEIIARGDILVRKDIQMEDFGLYICTANVKGFPIIQKTAYLAMKGPPVIKQPSVSYGREGQTARLSCRIESVPIPKDNEIKWIFRNKTIFEDSRHKIYKEGFRGGVISVLQILSVQPHHFGDYNCTVKTDLGYDTVTVFFQRKGETPILMIVGATIIFLFILLVTTVVLCVCQRKKLKDDYLKGNPSSPEIPLHHEAKSTLIDSDCHCNPNLYSWIPQSFDVKTQNDVLNKIHYQDSNFWPSSHEIESCYSNSGPDSQSSNKSIKINKQETISTNPILYNMHTIGTNTLNRFSSHQPFANLSLAREKDPRFCDASQCPQFIYQDIFNPINDPNLQITQSDITASPIYIVKKPTTKTHLQFPTDYYNPSKPIIKTKINNCPANMEMYSDQPNTKLISDYASNI